MGGRLALSSKSFLYLLCYLQYLTGREGGFYKNGTIEEDVGRLESPGFGLDE